MTAATAAQTLTIGSIAEDLGITFTSNRASVTVHKDGSDRRVGRLGTDEQTRARVLLGHLHPESHPAEWQAAMDVLAGK